jgi:hypothetical protein
MNRQVLAGILVFACVNVAQAETINFDNTEVPSINILDPVTTQWSGFGLGIQNAFWYLDPQDPFDQMGLSVFPVGSNNVARIDFLGGPVSDLSVDWWTSGLGPIHIDAFDSADNLLDHFDGEGFGTQPLVGSIAYLTWHNTGGFVQISSLHFLRSSPVPEPSSFLLVGSSLAGLGVWRKLRTPQSPLVG